MKTAPDGGGTPDPEPHHLAPPEKAGGKMITPKSTYTFEQIEAGVAILREFATATSMAHEHGDEVDELDYLKHIAEALSHHEVMR